MNVGKEKAQRAAGLFHDDSHFGTPRRTGVAGLRTTSGEIMVNRAAPLSACNAAERVKLGRKESDESAGFWPLFFGKRVLLPVTLPFPYENEPVTLLAYIHSICIAPIESTARYTDRHAHFFFRFAGNAWSVVGVSERVSVGWNRVNVSRSHLAIVGGSF